MQKPPKQLIDDSRIRLFVRAKAGRRTATYNVGCRFGRGFVSVYDFSAKLHNGTDQSLEDYKASALRLVNTASQCGFTPQYKGLQELYAKYHDKGLEVLGFPCDQFGHQEPGSAADIASFCELNYGVSFPLFSKIDVNGEHADTRYNWLA